MALLEQMKEAAEYIQSKSSLSPNVGIILGSGLGNVADEIENKVSIAYEEIPHFATSSAIGHANQLVMGTLKGQTVVAMKGRYHFYEGYDLQQVTFPVRVMKALGVNTLLITNSCGAVNTNFSPGELMLIRDHLNLVGTNALIGENEDALGPRFPDLSEVYSSRLRQIAKSVAAEQGTTLQEGVYSWWSGPAYETPAEVRMIRILGGDAVGMSTVPEATVAAHAGMEVLGISCLTNMACGILEEPLSHDDVIEVAGKANAAFTKLVKGVLDRLPAS
ncbi:purine-nucleoside phosphorylase [Shouchella clausii]|uniref:purine-nucleoside phosphorylase n=1 Tax=Shouchella clausii TaxID=79880 RepID=UPI000BA73E4F|nr:purine-nucleoside phosphorylase [Shouchella clausii]PAD92336.1 purine-nucleoside phosphorylase [Shouchella clausii]